jgi:hypothetical protein
MPINKTGGYSGRNIQKAHTGTGHAQDGFSGSRTLQGQTTQATAQPPKTTGSAPAFQNNGGGSNTGGNKPK